MLPPIEHQSTHPAGRCSLDLLDSTSILTSGPDGFLRVLDSPSGQDENAQDGVLLFTSKEPVVCVRVNPVKNRYVAIALDDQLSSSIQLLEVVEDSSQAVLVGNVTTVELGVRDMAWAPDGDILAVATEADGLRIVNINDVVGSLVVLGQHLGPVKGVAFDPLGKYLVTTGADGTLKIWTRMALDEEPVSKLFPASTDSVTMNDVTVDNVSKPAWSVDGSMLAVPGTRKLVVLKRSENKNWDEEQSFERGGDFPSRITLTAFSKTRLAACSAQDKPKLMIWNLQTKSVERTFETIGHGVNGDAFRSMIWCENPDGSERLVAMSNSGKIFMYDFQSSRPTSARVPAVAAAATNQRMQISASLSDEEDAELFADDYQDASNSRLGVNLNLTASENNQAPNDNRLGANLTASQDDDGPSLTQIKREFNFDDEDTAERSRSGRGRDADMSEEIDSQLKLLSSRLDDVNYETDKLRGLPRDAFQPGSTPVDEDNRRFLVWNRYGSIVTLASASMTQQIEISFSDASLHRQRQTLRFVDPHMYDKASMSDAGALFSSSPAQSKRSRGGVGAADDDDDDFDELDDDDVQAQDAQAVLHYKAFQSPWSSVSDWKFNFPKREHVTALACADEFSVCSTNRGFIRIFRPSGLQEPVQLAPGNVHAMCAMGSWLFIIYHEAAPTRSLAGGKVEYKLGYVLLDVGVEGAKNNGVETIASGPLRCMEGISWCGFADDSLGCMPVVSRKDGVLFGLAKQASWSWVTLSDATWGQEKGVKLWPISVNRDHGLVAAELRGQRIHPNVAPRSALSVFTLRLPLLGMAPRKATQKNRFDMEQSSLLDQIALSQRTWAAREDDAELFEIEAKADVSLLRSFVVAIKQKQFARALGIAKRLRLERSKAIAVEKAQDGGADAALLEMLAILAEEARIQVALEEEEEQVPEPKPAARVERKRTGAGGMRVGFRETPASDDEDDYDGGNTTTESPKKRARSSSIASNDSNPIQTMLTAGVPKQAPLNRFLKSTSPATRKSQPSPYRPSPIRQPELNRTSTFTQEARESYRRKL